MKEIRLKECDEGVAGDPPPQLYRHKVKLTRNRVEHEDATVFVTSTVKSGDDFTDDMWCEIQDATGGEFRFTGKSHYDEFGGDVLSSEQAERCPETPDMFKRKSA